MTTESQPRKEDAATQQIAREAADEIGLAVVRSGLTPKGHEVAKGIILSAIERATEHMQGTIDFLDDQLAQPQPSKEQAPRAQGSPAHGDYCWCDACTKSRQGSPADYCWCYACTKSRQGSPASGERSEQYNEKALVDKLKPLISEPRGQQQEWTDEIVKGLVKYNGFGHCADCHNAALAAERERTFAVSRHLEDAKKDLADLRENNK